MKTGLRVILVLFIILIVGLVIAFFSLDRIVHKGIETVGPAVAKVEVKVKNVHISPFSGSGKLGGLLVGNPPGYKSPSAIQVGSVAMKLEPKSVLGDKIVVHSLRMEAPEITFEGGPKDNNLNKILENVQGTEEKAPATKEEKKAQARKLQVDDFLLTGGKVHVNSPLLGGKTATLPIPEIHLTGLGQGAGQPVGGRGYDGYTLPPRGEGVFASSDQAEGPLSQLTFSLSCEPPSAAGARA